MENKEKQAHSIEIGNKIIVNGVVEVIKIEKDEVILKLENKLLILCGKDFNAEKLNITDGLIIIKGYISSLKYSHSRGKESFFKKLIK